MRGALRPRLELLGSAEVERVVADAGATLARVGIAVDHAAARELLGAAGAPQRDGRWLLSEELVGDALATAPRRIVVCDRDGATALDLGGAELHFDPGSAALHVLDPVSRRRRAATTADAVRLARLTAGLPHLAAQSTALVAGDVPEPLADRWRLYLALVHCPKPVVTGTFRGDGFAPMHAMLAAVRGGEQALRERPLALFDCCPTSPLRWSELTSQALLDCARTGVPAVVVPLPMAGATAPVTLREVVAQHCAEALSGIVLHQLAAPGAPVVYGGAAAVFDMRRGSAPMGAMETMMIQAACAQVGKHLGLPTQAYLTLSDAKGVDFQAGAESAAGAVIAALCGVDLVSGPGLLDYLLTQSLEKLLLDHELCGMALRLRRGLAPGAGDVVELAAALVTAGQLLAHPHTRQHWREELTLPSPLIDRDSYGDWVAAGAQTALERAAAEVERRLQAAASPLDSDLAAELAGIVAAEARRFGVERLPAAL